MKPVFTPSTITSLGNNDIFVFGSNIMGKHTGGAALFAKQNFGAIEGVAEGIQGQSYAIPTFQRTLSEIKESIDRFSEFVKGHSNLTFYVTAIGCKNAGYKETDIAPLFQNLIFYNNIILPKSFANIIIKNKGWSMYEFEKEGFRYSVVDLERNMVAISAGPKNGYVNKTIEYEGECYTVVGLKEDIGTCIIPVFYDDEYNYLSKGAYFEYYFYPNNPFIISPKLEYYGACPFPHGAIESRSSRFDVLNGLIIDNKYHRIVQCVNDSAEHIIIPDGIEEIYDGAFYGCTLKTIEFPKSLRRLQIDAFFNCKYLESITLPKDVEYLGDYCFSYCFNLKEVRLLGGKVKTGEYPFFRCPNDTPLYVPIGTGNKLKKIFKSKLLNNMIEY